MLLSAGARLCTLLACATAVGWQSCVLRLCLFAAATVVGCTPAPVCLCAAPSSVGTHGKSYTVFDMVSTLPEDEGQLSRQADPEVVLCGVISAVLSICHA